MREPAQVIETWIDWGDDREVVNWAGELIHEDKGLMEFLERFVTARSEVPASDKPRHPGVTLDPVALRALGDGPAVVERLQSLRDEPDLSEHHRLLIDEYLRHYYKRFLQSTRP
ncbi:hypothetical protein ACFL2Q_01555 [Thermodesulfobacteriota bacterium]